MLKKLFIGIILGFVWLLVFSIPVSRDKRIFDIGYHYVVDTKPMNWLVGKFNTYYQNVIGDKEGIVWMKKEKLILDQDL